MTAVMQRVFPPTGPAVLDATAAMLIETRTSMPKFADVRLAIHAVLAADAIARGWNGTDQRLAELEAEAFDMFERYESAVGWPRFRTVEGLARQMRVIARQYEREMGGAL